MYDKSKGSRLQKYYQFVKSICTEKDSVFIILYRYSVSYVHKIT